MERQKNNIFQCEIKKGPSYRLITLSLVLNLFLGGLVAGVFLSFPLRPPFNADFRREEGRRHNRFMPPVTPNVMMRERFAQGLVAQEGEKVRAIFNEEHKNAYNGQQKIEKAMNSVSRLFQEKQPDIKLLREALAEMESYGKNAHTAMARTMERLASELSWESRRKIAEDMQRGPFSPPPSREQPPFVDPR